MSRWPISKSSKQIREVKTGLEWDKRLLAQLRGLHWPERLLSVEIDSDFGSSNYTTSTSQRQPVSLTSAIRGDGSKPYHMEAVIQHLTANSFAGHRIVCGDFNAPRQEWHEGRMASALQEFLPDGSLVFTKKVTKRDHWRGFPAENWVITENTMIKGIRKIDLADCFRERNGYENVQVYTKYDNKPRENKRAVRMGR